MKSLIGAGVKLGKLREDKYGEKYRDVVSIGNLVLTRVVEHWKEGNDRGFEDHEVQNLWAQMEAFHDIAERVSFVLNISSKL